MSNENILFIVEGLTEEDYINKFNEVFQLKGNPSCYSYDTSIYELMDGLYQELSQDDDLDIILLLKEKETKLDKKAILTQKYSSIYLIFDFDPHYHKFNVDRLIAFQSKFSNACEYGLLLINYPMLEAIKHFNTLPDPQFNQLTINREEVRKYKNLIGNYSKFNNITCYHYNHLQPIITCHLKILAYLMKIYPNFPTRNELFDYLVTPSLIKAQTHCYEDDKLYVLATFFVYLFDLKSDQFLESFMW